MSNAVAELVRNMFCPSTVGAIVPSNESVPSNQRICRINGNLLTASSPLTAGGFARGVLVTDLYKAPSALFLGDVPQSSGTAVNGTLIIPGGGAVLQVDYEPARCIFPWVSANGNLIDISPYLAADFSVGRLKAFAVSVQASTISTTTAALGGLMASAVVASLDDLDVSNFSAITAASMLPESTLSNVPCYRGIYGCQGPFLSRDFGPLEALLSDRGSRNAAYTVNVDGPIGALAATLTAYFCLHVNAVKGCLISSYATLGGAPNNTNVNFNVSVDHGVYPTLKPQIQFSGARTGMDMVISVIDYYMYIDPNEATPGDSGVKCVTHTSVYHIDGGFVTDALGNIPPYALPSHTVRAYRQFLTAPNSTLELQSPRYVGTTFYIQVTPTLAGSTFQWASLDVDIPGRYDAANNGPKGIITWNGLNTNQQLTFTGSEVVEVVTNNNLSQYLSGSYDKSTADESDLQAVKALFLEPGGLKVYYQLPDASALFKTTGTVVDHLYRLSRANPAIGMRLSASGVFQGLGAELGGTAGSILDNTVGGLFSSGMSASGMSASGMSASGGRVRISDFKQERRVQPSAEE